MGYEQYCPKYERAMDVLGKKWTGLILRSLLASPRRFRELREQVPDLSDRVLSERLAELEREGVVARHARSAKPVIIEYALTAKGLELAPVIDAIQNWAERWYAGAPAEKHP